MTDESQIEGLRAEMIDHHGAVTEEFSDLKESLGELKKSRGGVRVGNLLGGLAPVAFWALMGTLVLTGRCDGCVFYSDPTVETKDFIDALKR